MQANKVLIIGPAWVGDMVMAQTLFRFLKLQHLEVIIDVVAPRSTASLLASMPEVRSAIPLPIAHGELGFKTRYALGKSLRREAYDQAIVLTNTFKSALIPWFANIPLRTGWKREMRGALLNDCRTLDKEKYPLMIERFVALGLPENATLPMLDSVWPQFSVKQARVVDALEKVKIELSEKPILALCPGAEFGPSKRWPEAHYAEVAKEKLAAGWDVWLFGGPNDKDVTEAIQNLTENQCVNLAGKTSLPEAICLMSLATAVVTNDSGLMHIAAALKKKCVVLYGSSSPDFTPPLATDAVVLRTGIECSPCFERECPLGHWKCLRELDPKRVITALGGIKK